MHPITIGIWLLLKLFAILYIPYIFLCSLRKSKSCPPIKNKLLLLNATELAENIRQKKITSTEVVTAYINRIKEVNPVINAVLDERFNEALQEAKNIDSKLDNLNEEEIKINKPLLGVPITVKGSIAVKGLIHSAGRVDRNIIPKQDATIVQYVRNAGAIPLLISNVPELCLSWETTNKRIGTTKNPYNTLRTVGGSSGGETSLLASGASVIGLGSDIAGSLRLPAHYCGVFGHKPTPALVSCDGHYPDCKHRIAWQQVFTLGPLARAAIDLRLILNIIVEPEKRSLLNLNKKVDVNDLRIYYMSDARSILADRVNSEILLCLKEVIQHLNNICSTPCKEVDIPLMKYCGEISYKKLLDLDEVENLFEGKGEGCYKELLRFMLGISRSEFYAISYGLLRRNLKSFPKGLSQNINNNVIYLREYFLSILSTNGVFICPTYPTEAYYHGEMYKRLFNAGPMSIFNSLGFPATHCPIKLTSNGLPIGVQIVAAPNCDNLTISVCEELERRFGGWRPILA